MKHLVRRLMPVAIALALVSITSTPPVSGQTTGTSRTARRPSVPPTQTPRLDAREFINRMGVAGLAEVELGKLASERAIDADVKAFAQMMVRDHSRANDELSKIASQLNLPMPTQLDPMHRELADRLSKLKDAEFDREYMAAMVKGHEDVAGVLRSFTSADRPIGTSGRARGEQALMEWAMKTMPTVERHLERARQIQQKLK
jgi:putative membrane protein